MKRTIELIGAAFTTPAASFLRVACVVLLLGGNACFAGSGESGSIVGVWKCRSHEIVRKSEGVMTVSERKRFFANGDYESKRNFVHVYPGGQRTGGDFLVRGTWKLAGKVLHVHLTDVHFLDSNSAGYTVAKGQEDVDTSLKKATDETENILSFHPLVTKDADPADRDEPSDRCYREKR